MFVFAGQQEWVIRIVMDWSYWFDNIRSPGPLRTSWDSAGMTYTMDVLGLGIITLTTSHQFVGYQQAQQQAEGLRIVQVGQPTPGSE